MLDNLPLIALGAGSIGLLATILTFFGVKKKSPGNQLMQDLAGEIHIGAMAFLRAEYVVLIPFLLVVAGLLGFAIGTKTGDRVYRRWHVLHRGRLDWHAGRNGRQRSHGRSRPRIGSGCGAQRRLRRRIDHGTRGCVARPRGHRGRSSCSWRPMS